MRLAAAGEEEGRVFQYRGDGRGRVAADLTCEDVLHAGHAQHGDGELPERFVLHGIYLNAFNPSTTRCFDLPEAAAVSLSVYDLLGRQVTRLVDASLPAGTHEVKWEAGTMPGGVYLCRIEAGGYHTVRQMVLVK